MFILNRNIKQLLKPKFALFLGMAFLLSLFFSLALTSTTQAKMTLDDAPSERAKSYSYWKATSKCVRDHMRSTIKTKAGDDGATSPHQAGGGGIDGSNDGEWFDDLTAFVSVYPDGKLDCDKVMKKAMDLWGWKSGKQVLQDMGYTFNPDIPRWERNNDNGDKRFEAFKSAVLSQAGNVTDMLDGSAKYTLYMGAFTTKEASLGTCKGKRGALLSSADATISDAAKNNKYRDGVNYTVIKTYDAEKNDVLEYVYTYNKSDAADADNTSGITLNNHGSTWNYRGTPDDTNGQGERYTCDELVKMINANATAFKLWSEAHADTPDPAVEGSVTCSGDDCAETGENASNCVVEGVGWIVCPITNFLAGIADASFGVISNFLVVNVKLLDTNSGTYSAWSAFRNIANVAFVIVFLIIIFSQLTGTGLSNYGIKKTLPRLVVAAILVNVSFYICQFAVDITQILGASIRDILKNVPIGGGTTVVNSWTDVMGDILMGSAILVGALAATISLAVIAGLSISLPVLLAALLAVLMTVIILVGRQAAIVILIVLSPLAFVAFILPNTESWFKKWYKMFFALLLVYPIIALLYGGGELTAKIISSVANSSGTDAGMKFWLSITAMGVAAIPLLMTPSLLKNALKGTGTLGAKLSGFASKANGRVGKSVNSSSKFGEAKQGLKNRFALNRAVRRGKSPVSGAIDNSRFGKALGLDKGAARALSAVDHEEDEEVKASIAQISHQTSSTNRIDESARILKEAIVSGNTTQARAAQRILLSSGNAGISALQTVYEGTHSSGKTPAEKASSLAMSKQALGSMGSEARQETMGYLRSEVNSAGLKGKNNALARWGYDAKVGAAEIGKLTNPEDELSEATFKKLNSVELAGQSVDNLEAGAKHISAEAAQAVLDNPAAASSLDDEKRAIFSNIVKTKGVAGGTAAASATQATAGGSAAPSSTTTAGNSTTTTTASTATSAPAQGTGNPAQQQSAAVRRALDTAEAARIGQTGDGVFVAGATTNDETTLQVRQPATTAAPTQAAPQATTPPTRTAGEARTTTNSQGQNIVQGQRDDTIDRMSR